MVNLCYFTGIYYSSHIDTSKQYVVTSSTIYLNPSVSGGGGGIKDPHPTLKILFLRIYNVLNLPQDLQITFYCALGTFPE